MEDKERIIIKQYLQKMLDELPEPKRKPDFEELAAEIERRRNKTRKTSYRKYYTAAGLLLIFVLFFYSNTIDAKNTLFHRMFISVKQDIGKIMSISTDRAPEDQIEQIEEPSLDEIVLKDMDEAQGIANGKISLAGYIPSNYKLKNITIYKFGDKIDSIYQEYVGDEGKTLIFKEAVLYKGSTTEINYKYEKVETTEFTDQGIEYIYLSFPDGTGKLIWSAYDKNYVITGYLDKQEMHKIAKSIKN
jgi:hypothetical protein